MRLFIFAFLAMILLALPSDGAFIGKKNLWQCTGVNTTVSLNKNIENAETYITTGEIWINPNYFKNKSPLLQQFIFQHECGHAHGIRNESGADTYAFYTLETTHHMNKNLIKEICATGIDKSRCDNLRQLYKQDFEK